jgi:hypothetical protein
MKTTERSTELPEKVKPTTIESVKFRDGMIVTADDLDAAMRYPASLLHTVLRAYFGCGVVCGLGLRVKEPLGKQPTWVICVDRGVAIDCQGHPIELCASVELDLSPDACDCEPPPEQVCIAVRRITSDEAPRDACSCDVDDPHFDCRRVREHVVVKAFTEAELDAPPGTVCRRTPDHKGTSKGQPGYGDAGSNDRSWSDSVCDAMTVCPPSTCGECWVLLGCVTLSQGKGITGTPDTGDRQWVKPIEALCTTVVDRIKQLEDKVAGLPQPPADRTPAADQTPATTQTPAADQTPATTQTPAADQTSTTTQTPPTDQTPTTA